MATRGMEASGRAPAPVLMIRPAVPAWRIDGRLYLDRKFKDGMDIWASQWPGRLRAVMDVVELAQVPPFGASAWAQSGEPFELEVIEPGAALGTPHLSGVDVLLASADDPRQLVLADLCRAAGVACIYSIEYTLSTRFDMCRYSAASRYQKLKTSVWLLLNEIRLRRAIGRATAVQANGIPAFQLYANQKGRDHLYFDTRLATSAVVAAAPFEARLRALSSGGPLRLAFSGRLIASKGADALIPLAIRLNRMHVEFQLDIYGAGDLEKTIADDIRRHGLAARVRLHGAVDFDSVLVPTYQREIDLFICCHRQGDPSCTYAETLGCGIPFVGYANEALRTLVERFDVGWVVAMNDEQALAELIASLSVRRDEIRARSVQARAFGLEHSFEPTFRARMDHCLAVMS